ncbi:hypothetical protein [Paraconexibacter sp.]|uniref:hypothetical protein n=1 Tax=Paraconexibacter sp. TaxID=2949640 RepID=UPI003564F535
MPIATLVLAALLMPASPATASTKTIRVGIANQDTSMFDSPYFKPTKVKRTRYVVRWDAARLPEELKRLDAFVNRARKSKVKVLLHISTNNFARRKGELPSRKKYKKYVGKLISRYYRKGVRDWGTWNEANDSTQPTYNNPKRAADYFKDMYGMLDNKNRCGRRLTRKCNIVALDLLDGRTSKNHRSTARYVQRFYKRLSKTWDRRARTVGLHNYSDTNRKSTRGTRSAIKAVKKYVKNPNIWLTETGGIVKLGKGFPCDPNNPASVKRAERKADSAIAWMFRIANRYKRDIDRIYVYQWTGTSCLDERYDYGLVRADGSRRAGYYEVRNTIRKKKLFKP